MHHVDPACRRRVGEDRGVDTPARPPATVLLDLDGTLIDSAPGILGSLAAAFAELGIPLPDGGLPRTLLGPPLYRSLPPLVGADRAPEMLAAYRRIYGEVGIRECLPFDGIDALLRDLAGGRRDARGGDQQGAGLRREDRRAPRLDGAVRDGLRRHARRRRARRRPTSSARRCAGSADPTDAIMVGDRLHDVEGARVHGLGCLGLGWGYAAPGELEEAGALAVYPDPAALGAALHAPRRRRRRAARSSRRFGRAGVDQVRQAGSGASAAGSSGTSGGTGRPGDTAAARADSAGAVSMPEPPCPATNQKPGWSGSAPTTGHAVRDERPQPGPARHDRAQPQARDLLDPLQGERDVELVGTGVPGLGRGLVGRGDQQVRPVGLEVPAVRRVARPSAAARRRAAAAARGRAPGPPRSSGAAG